MSREETTTSVETITTKVLCDFCDNGKSWTHPKACANKCGRDVCHLCGTDDPTDYGDYIDRYCPTCWALEARATYFDHISASENRRDALEDKWREAGVQKEEEVTA